MKVNRVKERGIKVSIEFEKNKTNKIMFYKEKYGKTGFRVDEGRVANFPISPAQLISYDLQLF